MKTCLIVDDSRVVRKVAFRIISDLGFSCTEAEDGQRAYDSFCTSRPDVVLLDWNMPVMNGFNLLEKMRAETGKQPKVILCTTESDMDSIRNALKAGADEFIIKPFNQDIIREKFDYLKLLGR